MSSDANSLVSLKVLFSSVPFFLFCVFCWSLSVIQRSGSSKSSSVLALTLPDATAVVGDKPPACWSPLSENLHTVQVHFTSCQILLLVAHLSRSYAYFLTFYQLITGLNVHRINIKTCLWMENKIHKTMISVSNNISHLISQKMHITHFYSACV